MFWPWTQNNNPCCFRILERTKRCSFFLTSMLPKKIEVCMNTCHKIFFKSFMEVINMAFSRIPIYFAVFLLVTSIQDVARMTYTGCKFWNTEPSSQHYIFKPFTPNIRMWILHTVFYTFFKVLTWRICLIIKSFFSWWSFSLFSWPWCVILGWYCTEKLDAYHS